MQKKIKKIKQNNQNNKLNISASTIAKKKTVQTINKEKERDPGKHRTCKMDHNYGTSPFFKTSHCFLFKHHIFSKKNTYSM